MQQQNLNPNRQYIGFNIGVVILSCALIFDIYTFFEQTSMAAKLLSLGSFFLLAFLLLTIFVKKNKMRKMPKVD